MDEQLWVRPDGAQIHVNVDDYGIVEVAREVLEAVLKAAGWRQVDHERKGPAT